MRVNFKHVLFRLGDALTASNCRRKEEMLRKETVHLSSYASPVLRSLDNKENVCGFSFPGSSTSAGNGVGLDDSSKLYNHEASVRSIIDKMQSGFEVCSNYTS